MEASQGAPAGSNAVQRASQGSADNKGFSQQLWNGSEPRTPREKSDEKSVPEWMRRVDWRIYYTTWRIAQTIFGVYVTFRQYYLITSAKEIPDVAINYGIIGRLERDTFVKTQQYTGEKLEFSMFVDLMCMVVELLCVWFLNPKIWLAVSRLVYTDAFTPGAPGAGRESERDGKRLPSNPERESQNGAFDAENQPTPIVEGVHAAANEGEAAEKPAFGANITVTGPEDGEASYGQCPKEMRKSKKNMIALYGDVQKMYEEYEGVSCCGFQICGADAVHYFLYVVLKWVLIGLPLAAAVSAYSTFVIEEKWEYNKTTPATFAADIVKDLLFYIIGSALGIVIAVHIIRRFLPYPLLCWVIYCIMMIGIVVFVQYVYLPIYENYQEIADPVLKMRIESMAQKLGFPLNHLYQVDASKRSGHLNAYFIGLPPLPQTIALYDTLISKLSYYAIEGVLAHEIGHWYHMDVWRNLGLQCGIAGITIFLGCKLVTNMHIMRRAWKTFGFEEQGRYLNILLACTLAGIYILAPLNWISQRMTLMMQRYVENAADAFAVERGYGGNFKAGFITLMREERSSVLTDPIYDWYVNSHPNGITRLQNVDALMAAGYGK